MVGSPHPLVQRPQKSGEVVPVDARLDLEDGVAGVAMDLEGVVLQPSCCSSAAVDVLFATLDDPRRRRYGPSHLVSLPDHDPGHL